MRKNYKRLSFWLTSLSVMFVCVLSIHGLTNRSYGGEEVEEPLDHPTIRMRKIQGADFEGDRQHQKCKIQNRTIAEAPSESSFKQLEQDIKSSSRLAMVLGFFQPTLTWRAGCYMWNYDQFPEMPPLSIAATGPMALVLTYGVVKFMREKNTEFNDRISKFSPHQRGNISKLRHGFSIEKNVIFTLIALEFCLLTYGIFFEPDIMSNVFPGPKR